MLQLIAASILVLLAGRDDPTLVFRGGRLFDAERGVVRPLGQLWVRDGRILGERPAEAEIPAGAKVVDTAGCTVLPGFLDLHSHVSMRGAPLDCRLSISRDENLTTSLYCGVTNVLDLLADERVIFEQRERARSDPQMARLWAAGTAFTRPGGHCTQFGHPAHTCDTVEDVERGFEELLPRKPDAVKAVVEHGIWGGLERFPTLDGKLLGAVVDRAHAAGVPVFCHVWRKDEALTAVRAGADVLAHSVWVGSIDEAFIGEMKKAGCGYVATLGVVWAPVLTLQKTWPYRHELVREALHPDLFRVLRDKRWTPSLVALPMARFGRKAKPVCWGNLLKIAASGITLGVGTDSGSAMVPHGPAYLLELELYVRAGLSPARTLQAATIDGARLLRVADDFGSLAAGKVADVVVVAGDPLRDITEVWKIRDVYKAGVAMDRAAVRRRNERRRLPAAVERAGSDVPALVDDFEDGDLESAWEGTWTPTSDFLSGGFSTSRAVPAREGKRGVLRVEGELRAGFRYGSWSGVAIQWEPDGRALVDASGFEGIELRVRSQKERPFVVTLHRAAVEDFCTFGAVIRPRAEWVDLRIPFSSFRQLGPGTPIPWSAKDLTGLQIDARKTGEEASFGRFVLELDHVRLY